MPNRSSTPMQRPKDRGMQHRMDFDLLLADVILTNLLFLPRRCLVNFEVMRTSATNQELQRDSVSEGHRY